MTNKYIKILITLMSFITFFEMFIFIIICSNINIEFNVKHCLFILPNFLYMAFQVIYNYDNLR